MGDVVMFRALLVIQSATRRLERWCARKKNTVKGIRDAKNTVSGNDATETDQRRDLDLVVFFAVVLVVVFVDLPLAVVLAVDFALLAGFFALAAGFFAGFAGAAESRARFAPDLADFGPSTRSRHHAMTSSQM